MSKILGLDNELKTLSELAPAGYFLGLHIRFTSPLVSVCTYAQEWQDHYTDNVYAMRDPIVAWGYSTKGACRWNEIGIPDPFGIITQAADYGLKHGVCMSFGPFSSRSIGAVARADREYEDDEIQEALRIFEFLHEKTEPPERLTKAQQEALTLIAAGNRHAEAAAKLGISESALKVRLTAARNRLLARTTAEAIQRAKEYKLL